MTSQRSRTAAVTLALLAVAALLLSPAAALIETLEVVDDDRHAFHIDSFGYEPGGKFEITLTDFQLLVPPEYEQPQPGKVFNIAFVLQRSSSDSSVRIESGTCFHESQMTDEDNRIFVPSTAILPPHETYVYKLDITKGGYYHLYFSNCEASTQVDFKLRLVEYNTDTGSEVYLSAGEQSLPTWFFVLSLAFVVQLVAWIVVVRKNSDNVRNIHHLMTVVLVLKFLSLFFLSMKYHSLKYKGHADGWAVAYFIFAFLKGMMMFTVIVLIGTGWSYLKPFLTERDKQTMLVMFVFQFMFNVAALVLEETTPGAAGWITWRDILYLLDMICCCIILLPIMWSIRHLREAAEVDGKAARNMVRLKRFRTFYLLVVSYVYFTRIVVFLLNATLPFEMTWLGTVISEVATLAFYGVTGWLFRPQQQNPYLALDTDDGTGTATVVPSAEVEL